MTQKMNSLPLSVVNRNMHVETEAQKLPAKVEHMDDNESTVRATFESVSRIAETIAEGRQKQTEAG